MSLLTGYWSKVIIHAFYEQSLVNYSKYTVNLSKMYNQLNKSRKYILKYFAKKSVNLRLCMKIQISEKATVPHFKSM